MQDLIEQFTYAGAFVVLLLGGIGVPIPEEMPIIVSAVLARQGASRWWIAVPVCVAGVLSGDVILYCGGWRWGHAVLDWRPVRFLVSRRRARQVEAAYRRHAIKTIITARHVVGLRAVAFLTAGIVRVPFRTFFVADTGAAAFSVSLDFALADFFTDRFVAIMRDVRHAEHWLALLAIIAAAATVMVLAWRGHRRLMNATPSDNRST